jgi:uncharacterized membrane protein YdjX (TVP38/TMEM64 family)
MLSIFLGAPSAGAVVAFLLGRFLLRDWLGWRFDQDVYHAIFEALDIAFEEKGVRTMALLRLSPIMPFKNAINYTAGRNHCGFLLLVLVYVGPLCRFAW